MPVSTVAALQLGSLPDGKAATLEQILGYEDEIKRIAVSEGMLTLQASAREVVKLGETTLDEVLRVTASDH